MKSCNSDLKFKNLKTTQIQNAEPYQHFKCDMREVFRINPGVDTSLSIHESSPSPYSWKPDGSSFAFADVNEGKVE